MSADATSEAVKESALGIYRERRRLLVVEWTQTDEVAPGATESTVFGPFFVEGAPRFATGDDIAVGAPGEPCFMEGRVLTVVFSEFGRRVESNESGTDHGAGGLMMAMGSSVRGGMNSKENDCRPAASKSLIAGAGPTGMISRLQAPR